MNDETQDNLDVMLADHLAARLSGQLGRAAGAFEAKINADRLAAERRRNRRAWIIATFPAALAACIALVATVGYYRQGQKTDTVAETPRIGAYEQATYYRDIDDGTIVVNSDNGPVPVRALRRQEISETQWTNPKDQTKISVRVPREKTVYVNLSPY